MIKCHFIGLHFLPENWHAKLLSYFIVIELKTIKETLIELNLEVTVTSVFYIFQKLN